MRKTRNQGSDLTGKVFLRLTVVERAGESSSGEPLWRCLCQCGVEKVTRGRSLTIGATQSCGCLQREKAREAATVHGHCPTHNPTPEYRAYTSMLSRCLNPNQKSYSQYGGAGVEVGKEFKDSFSAFLQDIGIKPSQAHSVDRIDNTKGYVLGNVRWATAREQANNRKSNHRVEWQGQVKTVAEWARLLGIKQATLGARLRNGWSVERALTPL